MKNFLFYKQLLQSYQSYFTTGFDDRYISFEMLKLKFEQDVFSKFDYEIIGYSKNHLPIYALNIGSGKTKILIWSQMHGNESTTTKAILDFLNFIEIEKSSDFVKNMLDELSIKIIPMLNPDGATEYKRFNANEIDLNRDAINQSQPETKAFFKTLHLFNPSYCFNMHGQRTIFSAGDTEFPATVSFLAPSYNKEQDINSSRLKAIKVIVAANNLLQNVIPNQVGRYDGAYNANCFGDHIQRLGIPTVLFEAGHFPNDYMRNETRKFILISFLRALDSISSEELEDLNADLYYNIPMNKKLYIDYIINNVKNAESGQVGIHFKEVLENGNIIFQPFICKLDDCSSFYAHHYLDANGKEIFVNGKNKLKVNMIINTLEVNGELIKF